MTESLPYDIYSPTSIENHAKLLENKTFYEVLPQTNEASSGKGGLGQLIEKHHFYYEPNSDKEPDFKEAGVELKLTPYKVNQNGTISAKERIVLNIINYMDVIKETFDESSFLHKNRLLLLVYYQYLKDVDRLDYQIKYAQLFTYPDEDLKIIKDDWQLIVNKIREGKAHELSEGDTFYLGACTKGKDKSALRCQPNNEVKAMQRAFSLKSKYATYILNQYIRPKKVTYEPIIKDLQQLENIRFEDYITGKINMHIGMSIQDLALKYEVKVINLKNFASKVSLKMLGVHTNNAAEFEKANIQVKAIRIEKNGSIKESMSFPTFKFKDLIKGNWEESQLRMMFAETKFLFIIFRYDNEGVLKLEKGLFWNMPLTDLDGEVKRVWETTVDIIRNGVKTWFQGTREFNNLPSPKESPIVHVRPHAQKKSDSYPLPDGRELTKQCFWLRNTYILQQIRKGD